MSSRTIIVITGANTGLGYETVKSLIGSSTPYHIFVGGRSPEKVDSAIESFGDTGVHKLSPFTVDVLQDESIKQALDTISGEVDHIDVLINNAGAASLITSPTTARATLLQDYNTNFAGAYVMTDVFLPLLLKSASPRLLFITSGLSSLADSLDPSKSRWPPAPPGWPKPPGFPSAISYAASKTALNMLMLDFFRLLKPDGVKVCCVSPGALLTDLGGNREILKKMGAEDPALGGEFIKDIVEGKRDDNDGKILRRDIVTQAW